MNRQSYQAALASTDYPSTLTEALTGSKGGYSYGFTPDQVKQMQKMGWTVGDLQTLGLGSTPEMLSATQPGGGVPNESLSSTGQSQLQNATMLKLMLGLGGQQQPGSTAPGPGSTGPTGTVMNPLQLAPQQAQQQVAPQLQQAPLQPQQVVAPPPPPAPSLGFGQGQSAPPLNPIPIQPIPVQQYQGGGLVTYNNPPVGIYQAATDAQAAQQAQQAQGTQGAQVAQQQGLVPSQANLPPVPATMYTQGNMLYAPGQSGLIETGNPTYYGNATTMGSQLGAAALNMPMVIDLPPSGSPDVKSGVSKVPGTLIGANVPSVPQGPWLTNPSVFARAAMPQPTATQAITPQTPATSVPYAAGQAFATPPAAPGYTLGSTLPPTMAQSGATMATPPAAMLPSGFIGGAQGAGYVPQAFLQAHTSALANAGMALYSHFGGDPNSASPADIANFHSQLTGAVAQHIAGAGPSAGGAKPSAAGVKQASTGGMVPGRGSGDIVPALLEPGEYVIPKDQVAQLAARGVLKLQSGGMVPDTQSNEPPEARRQALTTGSSQSAQTSSPQIGGTSSLTSGLARAAQTYGSSMSGGGVGGGGIGGGRDLRNTALDPDPDLPYLKAAGMGGGGGLSSPAAQNALGGVASGLNQAAQAIASSVGPWQMQQSAIPDPSQLPKYQVPTLQSARVA
jgi:hypothetical protein